MEKETKKNPDSDMTTDRGHGSSHPTKANSSENDDIRETEGAKEKGNPGRTSHQEGQYDKQSDKPMQDK